MVSVKSPFAASSCVLGTRNGIIEASAGPKNVVTVETKIISRYSPSRLLPTKTIPQEREPAQDVGDDQHVPLVNAIHEDPGDSREDDGRDQEAQKEGTDGAVRGVGGRDHDRQAVDDHVAAHLRGQLGQPQQEEWPVLQDCCAGVVGDFLGGNRGPCLGGSRLGASSRRGDAHRGFPVSDECAGSPGPDPLGVGATARLIAAFPRSTKPARRRSTVRRSSITCRSQVRQRKPISAPRRSICHSWPPQG